MIRKANITHPCHVSSVEKQICLKLELFNMNIGQFTQKKCCVIVIIALVDLIADLRQFEDIKQHITTCNTCFEMYHKLK